MNGNIEDTIRNYALQNAVFFKGKANPKAVIGKILGEFPEWRSKSSEVSEMVSSIVEEVNSMGLDAQTALLQKNDSSLLAKKEKKERVFKLPDLKDGEKGVVMRIAPGPSGPLHIGHTRVSILNDEYVKRYGGKLICRFEDTNPEKIDPDAYDMIPEDLDWLSVKIHQKFIQSDRFELYYDIVKKLILQGNAYVCLCDADDWRAKKEMKISCPCRDLPIEEQMERYDKFMAGDYEEGKAVVVVKTQIDHPNPAVRDFVALRLVNTPHPRTGNKYIAYPMMNLSVAIDDHDMGMTHVIRGKDHLNNTFRQEYIYNYMNWKKPEFHHYGLVNIPDSVLKTSIIRQSISNSEYTGWDDVRTGTVRAMARRGIKPEAIRRYWVESGMKAVDIQFSWENLYGMNRDIIDSTSNRYFFVQDPVRYDIDGIDIIEGVAPLHPDYPDRGDRKYRIDGSKTIFISESDSKTFSEAGRIRLKDLCNLDYSMPAKYSGNDVSILRQGAKAVQWVGRDSIETQILMPDGTVAEGLCEPSVLDEKSDIVQFERFGFVRIESKDKKIKGVFSHR